MLPVLKLENISRNFEGFFIFICTKLSCFYIMNNIVFKSLNVKLILVLQVVTSTWAKIFSDKNEFCGGKTSQSMHLIMFYERSHVKLSLMWMDIICLPRVGRLLNIVLHWSHWLVSFPLMWTSLTCRRKGEEEGCCPDIQLVSDKLYNIERIGICLKRKIQWSHNPINLNISQDFLHLWSQPRHPLTFLLSGTFLLCRS